MMGLILLSDPDRIKSMPTIGQLLKAAREKAGLSQKELAEQAGMQPLSILRYENDQRPPSYEIATTLAGILNIPASAINHFYKKAYVFAER